MVELGVNRKEGGGVLGVYVQAMEGLEHGRGGRPVLSCAMGKRVVEVGMVPY
jgi:hypothetical protein